MISKPFSKSRDVLFPLQIPTVGKVVWVGGGGRGCYLLLGDVAFLGFDFLVFVFYYEVIKVLVARWERTHKG